MNRIIFVSDFFLKDIQGGGELNDDELIKLLNSNNNEVLCKRSAEITKKFVKENEDSFFIISNFVMLNEEAKREIENKKYLIYEHDHKYVKNRNPGLYKDFIIPKYEIVNVSFYKNAKAVFCQSRLHKSIIDKNISGINTISLSGNLWSESHFSILEKMALKNKQKKSAIMKSDVSHKNTIDSIKYCEMKKMDYELIPSMPYENFIQILGQYEKLIFFPKTPETLSRIAVEARMMNMSVVTNNNLGACSEEWFSLKGLDLIRIMKNKRKEIPDLLESFINNENTISN
jgi:hypothetical protein